LIKLQKQGHYDAPLQKKQQVSLGQRSNQTIQSIEERENRRGLSAITSMITSTITSTKNAAGTVEPDGFSPAGLVD